MKNIHVLPTDKPSKLRTTSKDKLILSTIPIGSKGETQNIYITSDEEIKEGDWCLLDQNVGASKGYDVQKCNFSDVKNGWYGFGIMKTGRCEKIILTTAQDLIKDGIQAIPDEFLEWFIKNPSCEFVKTSLEKEYGEYETGGGLSVFRGYEMQYKIVIPKKYPIGGYAPGNYKCNCTTCKTQFQGDKRAVQCEPCAVKMVEEQKQHLIDIMKTDEELGLYEEAALEYFVKEDKHKVIFDLGWMKIFEAGAKWKQEKGYSEEEVINLLKAYKITTGANEDAYCFFEQFKK